MPTDSLKLFLTAIDAYKRENWRALADLCDRASLTTFKETILAMLAPPPKSSLPLSATELMKAVPGMPRSVAEYQVHRFNEQSTPDARLRELMPNVESVAALEKMPPVEVFTAWLASRSFRAEVERAFDRKQMTRGMANDILAAGDPKGDFEALGVVNEGESIRYVVYKRTHHERPLTLKVRRQPNDSWMLVAEKDLLHVVS